MASLLELVKLDIELGYLEKEFDTLTEDQKRLKMADQYNYLIQVNRDLQCQVRARMMTILRNRNYG